MKTQEELLGKKRWTPIRRGPGRKIYCSPACGCGCTYASYVKAKKSAAALAKKLGRGWKSEVWENCEWHYRAISPCGRIKVHSPRKHDKDRRWLAFMGEPNSPGGRWFGEGLTPKRAVVNVIELAMLDLTKLGAVLKDVKDYL